jgi:hypothetical protein
MSLFRLIAPLVLLTSAPLPALAQSAAAPAPVDAARLAIATKVANRLLPDGIYKKLMSGTMDQMMSGMMGQMKEMPMASFAKMVGVSEEEVAALPEGTLGEMMAIMDPYFEERQKLTMSAVMQEMGGVMATMEPEMRAGMAEAYARRFNAQQLTELDAFFSTPTGSAYASEQMTLMMDPAIMNRMQAMLPKLMEAMPAIMAKAKAATAGLPEPKKPSDLTPAEQRKLQSFFGKKVK